MIRRSFGWVLGAALDGCTPIYIAPDAGPPNVLLSFLAAAVPPLGVLQSENLASGNGCRLVIFSAQVASSSPDAGAAIVGSVFLNVGSTPPASSRNELPLPLFTELPFKLDGPDLGTPQLFSYSLQQQPLAIALDPVVSWLFARNDSRTNYLTLRVTDGVTALDLIWGLDLSACDPRPF